MLDLLQEILRVHLLHEFRHAAAHMHRTHLAVIHARHIHVVHGELLGKSAARGGQQEYQDKTLHHKSSFQPGNPAA